MKKLLLMVTIMSSISFANPISLTGKVKVKGSAPHTYLVIEDSKTHKDYKVANAKDFNLNKMQNSIVNVKANITKKAIGAGFPAVIEILKLNTTNS